MRCTHHPDREAVATCSDCEKPICSECSARDGEGRFLCHRCIAGEALREFSDGMMENRLRQAEKRAGEERMRARRSRARTAGLVTVLAVCVAIMAVQGFRVYRAGQPPKPIRTGIQDTDTATDRCIQNLWTAAAALRRNQEPPPDLACPASGALYIVEAQDGETVVRCPNPARHGLSTLRVSRSRPVPEALR